MHYRTGIELGIRAQLDAIRQAASISDESTVDYFFVPETHPKFSGVDAFSALESLAGSVGNVTLGTGIVNVYSRKKEMMLRYCRKLTRRTEGRFVLGLGTSAPIIVENLYKAKFSKPLLRMRNYSDYIKSHQSTPVYWAVIGQKITKLAARHADGVIFFLRPEDEIRRSIRIIKKELFEAGKRYEDFEIISIRPTFIENKKNAEKMAKITIANYVGANKFYAKPLEGSGFKKEVKTIRDAFEKHGLKEASKYVSQKLVSELAITGSARSCAEQTRQHVEETGITAVINGFDLAKNAYNSDFFSNLKNLAGKL